MNETASFRSSLQWVHDYEIVLEKGFGGIREEAKEIEDFTSFEELFEAFLKQQRYFIKHAFIQQHEIIRLRGEHFASPLGSSLHKLCRDTYTDIHQPRIEGGIDLGYFEYMGFATVIDSLAAIKKLVFEEKL